VKTAFITAAWLLFTVLPSFASINVYAQASGSTSPITISGTASSSYAITGWTIYVDSNLVFRQNTSSKSISKSISMSTGTHKVVVKAWNTSGANGSAYLTVSVSGSGLIPTPPSGAKYFNNVDQMSGWTKCSACANKVAAESYWFKQWVSSPSLDGASMETYIKGSYGAWADDLFVKKFGDQTWARHIELTMNFLWNAPKTKQPNGAWVVQAMEFDARMLIGDFKYLFGTQCDYGKGNWDIWNNTKYYWQHTAIPCQKWGPNSWHKITWYFTLDNSTKYLHYAALRVDGVDYKVDAWLPAGPVPYNKEFLIQFEQDTDLNGDPWYLWVDKIQVALW
jgi:hypothetical protein